MKKHFHPNAAHILMRILSLFSVVDASVAAALPMIQPEPLASVVLKLQQTAERQLDDLCSYSVDRRYTIQNKHLSSNAVMDVHMEYQLGLGKHFDTPSMPTVHGLARRSLLSLLKEEEKASRKSDGNGRINSSNYDFAFLGLEHLGALACYRVRLKPRRKSKYLIDGEAWIDAQKYAVVQIKGQLSQKPSFWVKRPEVEQRFEEIQNFWLPSYNRSVTSITFVGETILIIEYKNYKVNSCQSPAGALPANLATTTQSGILVN